MRIAIIADPLDNQAAGIHVYTRELVKALVAHDRENEYILIRQKRGDDFPQLKQVVIRSSKVPIGLASLRLFFILPIVFRRLKVDAVLEPAHFGPFGVPKRAKRITVIHDLTPIKFPKWHRWHSQFLQKLFLKGILRRADLVLTNSQNTTKDLLENYPFTAGKTQMMLLGREVFFEPTKVPEVLVRLGIAEPYFLTTGTIEPRKNHMALLTAFDLYKRAGGEGQLVIAGGKGWKSKAVFEAIGRHRYRADIKVVGFIERSVLRALYTQATAFVYPSLYEGFGFPVLEAMSCGAPCLVSRASSLPEVGGEAVLYFDPHNPTELAVLMRKLAADPGLRNSLCAKATAQADTFSWERYVLQLKEALKGLSG